MLQSRALAKRTLDQARLWSEFEPVPGSQRASLMQSLSGAVRTVTGWAFKSGRAIEPPQPNESAKQAAAVDRFLSGLTVAPIRNSRLVDLVYSSPRADLTAQIANALARGYIQQNLEFRYNSSKEASDWLGQRLSEQRQQVESSEGALQRYREQNDAISLEERQNIVVQKLADLNTAVTRAKTERIQKESAYNQIAAMHDDRAALDTIPAILSNQFLQQQKTALADLQRQQAQLSEKLGGHHPEMVKVRLAIQTVELRIQGEITKVVSSLKNDYLNALSQEQSLVRALDQQKQDALAMNRKGIDYGVMRNAAINHQIFDALIQRAKETGISGELRTSNFRIVDLADVPRSPSGPNRPVSLALGALGGFATAICLAFFFEYVDDRIKSPDEIKAHLDLPFLGMLPKISGDDESEAGPLLSRGVNPGFAESCRTIRTNVLFSTTDDGGQSIVVTSSGPGEGKTVVASNLALALAQTGQRVLLVDADMRRPRVQEVFAVDQEPGLSNLLVGDAKMSEAIRPVPGTGLSLLPAGRIPPNPAELLGSKRFEDCVAALKGEFAWVIIDTPPVMAVTDAPIVAHIANGVVFVVGSEMTGCSVAQTAVEQLADSGARLIGAVLNRVDLRSQRYHYRVLPPRIRPLLHQDGLTPCHSFTSSGVL